MRPQVHYRQLCRHHTPVRVFIGLPPEAQLVDLLHKAVHRANGGDCVARGNDLSSAGHLGDGLRHGSHPSSVSHPPSIFMPAHHTRRARVDANTHAEAAIRRNDGRSTARVSYCALGISPDGPPREDGSSCRFNAKQELARINVGRVHLLHYAVLKLLVASDLVPLVFGSPNIRPLFSVPKLAPPAVLQHRVPRRRQQLQLHHHRPTDGVLCPPHSTSQSAPA
mmetsp:Transcript_40615/g.72972  ORF Transcript_40615/g.72972 Transcript_40615/m.72972 type:complete len:223 (+) Transcript_40615:1911-2579(+)